jgi:hypothetical protein
MADSDEYSNAPPAPKNRDGGRGTGWFLDSWATICFSSRMLLNVVSEYSVPIEWKCALLSVRQKSLGSKRISSAHQRRSSHLINIKFYKPSCNRFLPTYA